MIKIKSKNTLYEENEECLREKFNVVKLQLAHSLYENEKNNKKFFEILKEIKKLEGCISDVLLSINNSCNSKKKILYNKNKKVFIGRLMKNTSYYPNLSLYLVHMETRLGLLVENIKEHVNLSQKNIEDMTYFESKAKNFLMDITGKFVIETPHTVEDVDPEGYLLANPCVAASGMCPRKHFKLYGEFEGRQQYRRKTDSSIL